LNTTTQSIVAKMSDVQPAAAQSCGVNSVTKTPPEAKAVVRHQDIPKLYHTLGNIVANREMDEEDDWAHAKWTHFYSAIEDTRDTLEAAYMAGEDTADTACVAAQLFFDPRACDPFAASKSFMRAVHPKCKCTTCAVMRKTEPCYF